MALLKLLHSDAKKVIEIGPDNRDVAWFLSWVTLGLMITHVMRMEIRGLSLMDHPMDVIADTQALTHPPSIGVGMIQAHVVPAVQEIPECPFQRAGGS